MIVPLEKMDEICELISKALEEMGLTVNGKFTDQTRKLLEEQKIVVSMFSSDYHGRLLTATRLEPKRSFEKNPMILSIVNKINVDEQNAIANKYDFDVFWLFIHIKSLLNLDPSPIGCIRIWLAPLLVMTNEELDDIENVYKRVRDELLKYGLDDHEFCNPTSKFSCIFKNFAFMSYRRKFKSDLHLKAFTKHFYDLELRYEDYTEEEAELLYKYSKFHSAVASIARLKNMEITQVRLEIQIIACIDSYDKTIKVVME